MVAFRAMKIAVFRLLLGLLARLPLSLVRIAGRALGALPFGGRRRRVAANLALAFPELDPPARARLARRNRQAMVTTALETGPLWGRSRDWVMRHWGPAENRACVDSALASGRGLLLIGGHLGHWEASILYGTLQLPITYLYKPPGDPALDRALTARRSRFGGEFVATGSAGMRRALRRLRAGEAVGLLFDQLPKGGEFVEAPFFGRDVPTMTLAWRLARRTGSAVVLGHVLRTEAGWQARFRALDGLADETDPVGAAVRMNAALEQEIRRAPEQYLWRYRRFDPVSRPTPRDPAAAARHR
ncbi:lipid A biosynthesis acyltransferase [Wenzhouxiangella sp. XN79A]|uniref:lysophospholipid acyltransferase family protein n=1 Tax=Wenzhouxiangella sp. XN79A TaxID=2724193 RepID=UPI00144AB9B0|nr:lipid A biosynthesis acyltransferase [Wenzhouxiangella sp. XN79A]NKI35396.1 lipid A biosynthesis acyltransferase [Wenzhouxiangella sp. XN79A]